LSGTSGLLLAKRFEENASAKTRPQKKRAHKKSAPGRAPACDDLGEDI